MTERVLEGPGCIAEGAAWLAEREARFAEVVGRCGLPPLRWRRTGFGALVDAIVSQQISVAAAESILRRMRAAGLTGPRRILAADEATLRSCGLSGQKVRYLRALAAARIPFARLPDMPSEAVIARLTEVPGIGPWTAQIYLIFSLRRADAFAPGDLALQEAARLLFVLPDRPGERALARMAEAWSPWRGVAARLLWAYYRELKQREGIR